MLNVTLSFMGDIFADQLPGVNFAEQQQTGCEGLHPGDLCAKL